jgi:cyclophilin family peptidyl-prolyl cis-trans isomerase
MRRVPLLLPIPTLFVAALALAQTQGDRGQPPVTRVAIIDAEAARAASQEQLHELVRAANARSPLQPLAVRALGRLERIALVDTLVPILDAEQPAARAEAAWALAQSAGGNAAAARSVREALLRRLVGEMDADVRGAIGEALGRLPLESTVVTEQIEKALVDIASRVEISSRVDTQAAGGRIVGLTLTPTRQALVPMPALIGALRGLESLARVKGRAQQAFLPDTMARLRELATSDPATAAGRNRGGSRQAEAARARRLALLCLLPVDGVNAELAAQALDDADIMVRRLAISAPGADRAALGRGLNDPAWLVRYEALRVYGRRFQASEGCAAIAAAIGSEADHVSLLAIDLLGDPCRADDKAVERLMDLAVGAGQAEWRRPAHAIVALAKAAPDRARPYLTRFLAGEPWQSRMYGARAAAQVGDLNALRRLAGDANDNVREAAIVGLSSTAGHEADPVYVAALAAKDFQLVRTAAAALTGSPGRAAGVPALLAALGRLTALDADPSRDPRVALLERLEELGSREDAEALRPYLTDVDPRVADLAARILSTWTGSAVAAAPRPRAMAGPALTERDLQRLAKTMVRVTMTGGGQFDVKPLVDLAPVSAASFVNRAARGYYTGLTFHRVLPNFLIQGGSPGANEYMGDSRFMIDEPGRPSQVRGTVGTSTRGRDTGDGQLYVNLVDTPRLDHGYTIFGEVVRGMDVVDRILEGDAMKKVEVVVR